MVKAVVPGLAALIVFPILVCVSAASGAGQGTPDNYQRMKDCAAQVEKLFKRENLEPGSVENHYSPQFGRCFMQIARFNSEASRDATVPLDYYELWDAYEEKLLAICNDFMKPTFCTVQEDKEHFQNCEYCRTFVHDRMTK